MLFVCLLQQERCCGIMASDCEQECAQYCTYHVQFGLSVPFTFNCFVPVSTRCSSFSRRLLPLLGSRAGSERLRGMLTCPRSEQELPAFCRCLPTWLVPSLSSLRTWLLIALEIISFKLLVGDFLVFMWLVCG